ncbi:MAG: hypothetical protein OXI87_01790 [Albidovulum sp.]|nr:hypothetical protein [Albidovulum sp.]MDE0303605.1 hypothetical protein [Albidovulum sp.]
MSGTPVLTGEDGQRWIRFPPGTEYALKDVLEPLRIKDALLILISED